MPRPAANITKERLRELYIERNYTQDEVADYLDVSVTTVKRYLKRFNLVKITGEEYAKRYFWVFD